MKKFIYKQVSMETLADIGTAILIAGALTVLALDYFSVLHI